MAKGKYAADLHPSLERLASACKPDSASLKCNQEPGYSSLLQNRHRRSTHHKVNGRYRLDVVNHLILCLDT